MTLPVTFSLFVVQDVRFKIDLDFSLSRIISSLEGYFGERSLPLFITVLKIKMLGRGKGMGDGAIIF